MQKGKGKRGLGVIGIEHCKIGWREEESHLSAPSLQTFLVFSLVFSVVSPMPGAFQDSGKTDGLGIVRSSCLSVAGQKAETGNCGVSAAKAG